MSATGFEEFWSSYPRRVGKGAARAAWAKAVRLAAPEAIVAAIKAQVDCGVFRDLKFCPYPATWLNQERWDDEIGNSASRTAAYELAARYRAAALAGNDAAKTVVKAQARDKGIAWDDVLAAIVALRQDDSQAMG